MLAGMLHANPLAMMPKLVFIKPLDELKLRPKPWRPLKRAASEVARDLPWKPRPALGAATDHDSVRAGARECGVGVVAGHDVAVDHDRDRHRLLHGAHRPPARVPLVALATPT